MGKGLWASCRFAFRRRLIESSIGISLYPSDAVESQTLISRADEAMYNAKQSGRNTYRFFDTSEHSLL